MENIIQRSKGYVEPTGAVASAIADVLAFDAKHEMTERVILIRPDGTELFRQDGEQGSREGEHAGASVKMDREILKDATGCVAVHNHPVAASLSTDDIEMTDAWKCKGIWAVCSDGSRFYCEGLTDKAHADLDELNFKSSAFLTALVLGLRASIANKVLTPDEASSATDHLLLLGLNYMGYLKNYEFVLGDPIVNTLERLEDYSPSFRKMHRSYLLRSDE